MTLEQDLFLLGYAVIAYPLYLFNKKSLDSSQISYYSHRANSKTNNFIICESYSLQLRSYHISNQGYQNRICNNRLAPYQRPLEG